jgi:mannan endo-1,4-beta-mannosidase
MKKPLLIIVLLIFTSANYSQSFKTLHYLKSISGTKTLAGQHNREPLSDPDLYTDSLFTLTTKYPALWSSDFLFQQDNINNRWKMIYEAEEQWNKGAVVQIMFHTCPPTNAEPCGWNGGVLSSLTDDEWNQLVTEGTTLYNNWITRLDIIAPYLQYLKDKGVEVLFRPLHEMNQGVFWWGGRPGENGTAKLYRITHDYLTNQKGLTNLIWVWNLQDFSTLANDVNNYDPGSEYWDIISMDMYFSDGKGYTAEKYNIMAAKAGDKPLAIGECGTLPTVPELVAQPKWVFFMGWAELAVQQNTTQALSLLYKSIKVITLDEMPGWEAVEVEGERAGLPREFGLAQNYPNPFNPITNITYRITERGSVTLKVYDILGREVSELVNEEKDAGEYEVSFDASSLSSGVYCYKLQSNDKVSVKKMVLQK